ncbi:MAG: HAMP domain-containing protein [SAR202 cluster bacterium]|nr:HAMP domain-containing protein [SAR202 cluster bacterium]
MLTTAMIVIITTLMAITTFLDVRRHTEDFARQQVAAGHGITDVVGKIAAIPLVFMNPEAIKGLTDFISSLPGIEAMTIFGPDGRVLSAGPQPDDTVNTVPVDQVQRAITRSEVFSHREGDTFYFVAPIKSQDQTIGGIEIGFSTADLDAEIAAIKRDAVVQSLVLIAIGSGISFLFAKYFEAPIKRLAMDTRQVSEGSFNIPPRTRRNDEIGDLAAAFDVMAATISANTAKLEDRNREVNDVNARLLAQIEERRQIEDELRRSRERVVEVSEALRRDIASHVHGSVQNRLILLMHRLSELGQAGSREDVDAGLRELKSSLSDVIENEVREVSRQLYPSILRRGLTPALLSLADHAQLAIAVDVEIDPVIKQRERQDSSYIPEKVRLAAFRIAEEALSNTIKHAEAKQVWLGLALAPDDVLVLTIRDDGKGFQPGAGDSGAGMGIMNDYAQVAGGECRTESAGGAGTRVEARLPISGIPASSDDRKLTVGTVN